MKKASLILIAALTACGSSLPTTPDPANSVTANPCNGRTGMIAETDTLAHLGATNRAVWSATVYLPYDSVAKSDSVVLGSNCGAVATYLNFDPTATEAQVRDSSIAHFPINYPGVDNQHPYKYYY